MLNRNNRLSALGLFGSASLASAAFLTASEALAATDGLTVRTYASQVNDVDSVNTHWFETEDGVVLIDAQRLLPEAARALRHLQATTTRPVVAIIITHAHTDHYGGLPVWVAAYPEAQIYTDETTLTSIRTDARGFIAMRNQRHGERFPTQQQLDRAVTDAVVVDAGDTLDVGGQVLAFDIFGPSEAESTLVVTVQDAGVASVFVGDLINVGAPAVPVESIDNWLAQLDALSARHDADDRFYNGHGPGPVGLDGVAEQRRFLQALRDHVSAALTDDGVLDAAELDRVVFDLEAGWPFYEGVAGNTRRQIFAFGAQRVAVQLGGTVGATNGPTLGGPDSDTDG